MTRYWGPMTLLDKVKALFGFGGGDSGTGREAGVTVEREPSEPTATTEPESGGGGVEEIPTTDEPAGGEAEPAAEEAEPEAPDPEAAGESPDVLNGIGPAYAERLADAGVETVADLAGADAGALAEGTDISEKRLAGWIESAEEHLSETA